MTQEQADWILHHTLYLTERFLLVGDPLRAPGKDRIPLTPESRAKIHSQ